MENTSILNNQISQFVWKRKYQNKSLPFADKIPFIRELIINNVSNLILKKIYLFGSYAYGEPTEDSDIDLFIVIDNKYDDDDVCLGIKNLFFKYEIVPCDLLVKTEEEFEKKLMSNFNGVYRVIRDNGVVLYG